MTHVPMKTTLLRFLLMISLALMTGTVAMPAQDLGAAQTRMAERLPRIDALKAEGTLGENNRGLLEVRGASEEAGTVSVAENRDREAVYAGIARQTGATPAAVGVARARQIAAKSAPGVWLQRENGEWYRK